MRKKIRFSFLVLFTTLSSFVFAQKITVSGTVSDANGMVLPGVTILVKGTTTGTTTDFNGNYQISASQGEILKFSYMGFKTKEVTISDSTLDVSLTEDTAALDEVVITAMGISREKKSLGYSVQEVKSEDLVRTPQTNIVSALSGKVAGAQISSQGGAPGQGASIVIRGISSIDPSGNNEPLFIVDGVPISNDTYTDGGGSSRGMTNRSSDIDLDDIESLSVLKGGAATALYGVRAANGAIIITTKKGKEGRTTFNLTTSTSFDEVNKFPELQDQYTQGNNGVFEDGFWPNFGPTVEEAKALDPSQPDKLYHNFKRAYQSGYTNRVHLSATGGSEKATFYTSYSRSFQEGIVPFSNYTKNGAKVSGNVKLSDKLNVFGSVDYINSGGDRVNIATFNESLIYWANNQDVRDYQFTEGQLAGTQKGYYNNHHSGGNPIYRVKNRKFADNVDRFFGNLGLEFAPTDNLRINYRFGMDYYSDKRVGHAPAPSGVEGENTVHSIGYIDETRILKKDLTSNLMASYLKSLSDKFDLTLRVGFDIFQRGYDRLTVNGEELDVYNLFHLSNASVINTSQFISTTRTMGVYGEVGLSYDDFLYLTITDRNDWASTLPKNNRSFNYPSVSLGYIFTENFDTPDWLSFGKLRGSWAQIGKDAVDAYLTSDTYSATASNFPVDAVTGWTRPNSKADLDLKSELTQEIEFGAELRLLDNRLRLDVSWYKSNAKNQILRTPISYSSGYSSFTTNAGEIQNSGLELTLNVAPIRTNDFSWDLFLNFSNNKNKVVSLREGLDNILVVSESTGVGATGSQVLYPGEPYGTIVGTSFKRYYENPDDEDPLYLDKDRPLLIGSNGFPVVNNTAKILGNSTPDWIMNIGNTVNYKNFSLSFNFDFRQGFQKFNTLDVFFTAFGQNQLSADKEKVIVFDGYLADGTKNTQEVYLGQDKNKVDPSDTRAYGQGYYRNVYRHAGENFIQDASWIRLKDLSLTYSLPKDLLNNLSISSASLTASGHNLWLSTKYTGFDPQGSSGSSANADAFSGFNTFPSLRSYALSLRVTF